MRKEEELREVCEWALRHCKNEIFSTGLQAEDARGLKARLRKALDQKDKTAWARVLGHRYGLKTWHKPQSVSNTASVMLVNEDQVQTNEYDAIEYLRRGRFMREDIVALLQTLHGILQHREEGS